MTNTNVSSLARFNIYKKLVWRLGLVHSW